MPNIDPPPANPLTGLRKKVETHWKRHRLQAYRALQASGELDEALSEAVENTQETFFNDGGPR